MIKQAFWIRPLTSIEEEVSLACYFFLKRSNFKLNLESALITPGVMITIMPVAFNDMHLENQTSTYWWDKKIMSHICHAKAHVAHMNILAHNLPPSLSERDSQRLPTVKIPPFHTKLWFTLLMAFSSCQAMAADISFGEADRVLI